MLASSLFGTTLREIPSEVEIESHGLLLRAGYIRQLSAGIYSLLPLGTKLTRRIEAILRDEMEALGGQELVMPVVQPADLWMRTGRYTGIDDTMVRFRDRRNHPMVLAMTHEEVVADLCRFEVRSWRDLPRVVFQIQTKFRDELRPRGGLIRTREFVMKDSYSLCADEEQLHRHYVSHAAAYFRIAARTGLPVVAVESSTGDMGGSGAHEFTYLTDIGEDVIVRCSKGDYFANLEVAEATTASRGALEEPAPAPEEVATPGATSIEAVARQLDLELGHLLRSLFLVTEEPSPRLVACLTTGDRQFNEAAITSALGTPFRRATDDELQQSRIVAGFGAPLVTTGPVVVVADVHMTPGLGYVAGGNRAGFHLRHVVVGRDVIPDETAHISKVQLGDLCPRCGAELELRRGIEYGNIFKLGTKYSAALGATFVDETGDEVPVSMGSYGIGVGRLLACVAEEHHDERGLRLPASVSPFACTIVVATEEGREAAFETYWSLRDRGIPVLLDERPIRAGVKFADADLWGFPLRITASKRSLERGGLELSRRRGGDPLIVPVRGVVDEVRILLAEADTGEAPMAGDPALIQEIAAAVRSDAARSGGT